MEGSEFALAALLIAGVAAGLWLLARGMGAWAALFGLLSFELFGRLDNAVHDDNAWFDYQLRLLTRTLGL